MSGRGLKKSRKRSSSDSGWRCLDRAFCRRSLIKSVLIGGLTLCLFMSTRLLESPEMSREVNWVPQEGRSLLSIPEATKSPTFQEVSKGALALLNLTKLAAVGSRFPSLSHLNRSSVLGSKKKLPTLNDPVDSSSSLTPKVSVILTFHNFESAKQVIQHFVDSLKFLPDDLVSDLMVVVDGVMKDEEKAAIESAVDLCDKCRIYFLNGTVHTHRLIVSKFAHEDILVFLDGRTRLTDSWLEPMVKKVNSERNAVVSPRVLLTSETGDVISLGDYHNEITWDLAVVRGVDSRVLRLSQDSGLRFIDQIALSKEVFVIRKSLFLDLAGLTVLPNESGGEDAVLSLTVLNCGGKIYQSVRSTVYLVIPNTFTTITVSQNKNSSLRVDYADQPDFHNPSFVRFPLNFRRTYASTMTKIWMDRSSLQVSGCSVKVSISPTVVKKGAIAAASSGAFSRTGLKIKHILTAKLCKVTNFKTLGLTLQSKTKPPEKNTVYSGYIRSFDGMFAFGVASPSFAPPSRSPGDARKNLQGAGFVRDMVWDSILLTRNSSLWMGPVSFVDDNIIYNQHHCLTTATAKTSDIHSKTLTLTQCVKGRFTQRFAVKDHTIRPMTDPTMCVQVRPEDAKNGSLTVSFPLTVDKCPWIQSHDKVVQSKKGVIYKFKFDMEFHNSCIT